MRIELRRAADGIAMVIVLVAIFVLAVLAGAFAYSMKVETKLAMNADNEEEVLWTGRSGVDYCRWILAQVNCPYDSLNQIWAGGPGSECETNGPLTDVENPVHVGNSTFTWKIEDMERKANINFADEPLLQQALTLVGLDADEIPPVSAAILDWIDPDDIPHINGTESDYYQTLDPPYYAKNGPIDDLTELLLVKGIDQDMYWGSSSTNHAPAAFQKVDRFGRVLDAPVYSVGLEQVFTALSSGKININTASATTLQLIPLMDANSAEAIIKQRAGPDGVDGTDDDIPFRNVGEAGMAVNPQLVPALQRYCDVRSRTFKVEIQANVGGYQQTFHAILGRNSPRDVQVLSFYSD